MSIFSKVVGKRPKRSTFHMNNAVKFTGEMGQLIPFMCEETLPGDTWKVDSNVLLRFAPLQSPVMHRMFVSTFYFYVPFRLIWEDYEEFITGGPDGSKGSQFDAETPIDPVFPRLPMLIDDESSDYNDVDGLWSPSSLADYLNYPTTDSNIHGGGMNVSALPFRAYQLIWNEYFRDENLQEDLTIDKSSGIISQNSDEYTKLLTLRNRAWRKDYFTSALPWTQRGPQQTVPVFGTGVISDSEHPTFVRSSAIGALNAGSDLYFGATTESNPLGYKRGLVAKENTLQSLSGSSPSEFNGLGLGGDAISGGNNYAVAVDNSRNLDLGGVEVNLEELGFNISDLRRANRIQRWLERQARGGSRYIESLLAHWGIISDDLRLQRPELLGGGVQEVQVSDILQTSETTETSPQGKQAGVGFSFGSKNGFKRSFKERGYIIGIVNVNPVPGYMEGLPRAYRKFDKFDFAWPEFAALGEQEIYNYELALRGNDADGTFGYAPRYSEYKYIPDRVHGDFKTSLDFWNMNRKYENQPALTEEFIECNAEDNELNRIFAVETAEYSNHLWFAIGNTVMARRPLPYNPDPSL